MTNPFLTKELDSKATFLVTDIQSNGDLKNLSVRSRGKESELLTLLV